MSLFRSEAMSYVQIMMTEEGAASTMAELGTFGHLHLVDLSTPDIATEAALYWKKRVQQCDTWEKRLQVFIEPQILEEYRLQAPPPLDDFPKITSGPDIFTTLTNTLEKLEAELARGVQFRTLSSQTLNELEERKLVYNFCARSGEGLGGQQYDVEEKSGGYSSFGDRKTEKPGHSVPLLPRGDEKDHGDALTSAESGEFSNRVVGMIPADRQVFFERMMFRMSRGNVICRFHPMEEKITDPASGELMSKSFFSLMWTGSALRSRILRVCNTFQATRYTIPSTRSEVERALKDLDEKISESKAVLTKTTQEITQLLISVLGSGGKSQWAEWLYLVQREKAICDAMRKCDLSNPRAKTIRCEAWVPTARLEELKIHMNEAAKGARTEGVVLRVRHTDKPPPTFFKTNEISSTFQGIVDTYGVPRYQEVNPGMFTIVTFPFLFGVMYGDIGHGVFLTCASGYLLLKQAYYKKELRARRMNDEIFKMVFGGRYLLFMMGLFATYAGFIYNDCMSVPIDLFGTHWTRNISDHKALEFKWDGGVYPFGVDPSWYHTSNELAFMNSLKMKMAVTIGVIHMTFGVFLSLSNHLFWKDSVGIFCEFIPRLLFLLCTFGYMIFIIIFKMCVDWTTSKVSPPNLVVTMIAMFLSPGNVEAEKQLYEGQATIQAILLLIAFISVPWMLFGPPCCIRSKVMKLRQGKTPPTPKGESKGEHKHKSGETGGSMGLGEGKEEKTELLAETGHSSGHGDDGEGHGSEGHAHGMPADIWAYSFGDSMITAGIHTIEYVLGTVSNTASYLRLWALSLAHSELASVFWSKMMQYGIRGGNLIMAFVAFAAWFGATFAVLLTMDVLECFLHALRLHWVEFQNKFYYADGYAYEPFRYYLVAPEK